MKPQKVHKNQMVETMISLSSNRSPVIKNAHCKSTKCKMQKSQHSIRKSENGQPKGYCTRHSSVKVPLTIHVFKTDLRCGPLGKVFRCHRLYTPCFINYPVSCSNTKWGETQSLWVICDTAKFSTIRNWE